jgi:3-oxoacyl-[acyl-carrier protein] reductase
MPISSGLSGQRVLVTAASRGIGFGAAKAFLEEGARVVINSSNEGRLNSAVKELSSLGDVRGIVANLTLKKDLDLLVDETVSMLGGVDALVYVTGSPPPGVFMEKTYDDWDFASKLLVVSPAYLARKVAGEMIQKKIRGRLVFLTSYAIREPIATIATSSVCRVAVAGMVRTLARELGPKGIRVNGILPGNIRTARLEQIAEDRAKRVGITKEEALVEMEKEIPLGRIGTTEELARCIVFLGSEMSEYITGAMVPVDGGILRSIG